MIYIFYIANNKSKLNRIVEMEPQKQPNNEQKMPNCEFFVERKRRKCKFPAMKGSKYCAAHCSDLADKIECPYQKGMFIDAAKFERHLQICPKIKNKQQQEKEGWFNKGVNVTKDRDEGSQINRVFEVPPQKINQVISKLIPIFLEQFKENPKYFIASTPEQKIENMTNDHTQAHLIAKEAHEQGLITSEAIYLQFGAGKGILSFAIANLVKEICKTKSKNVLLEREARRNKFDRFMKDNPFFQRYRSDVADFDMQTLSSIMAKTAHQKNPQIQIKKAEAQLNDMKLIGICKHMCGGALDISVHSLLRTKMSGCILASCCHHLCSPQSYLNNKFFEDRKFSQEEIRILFKISSWGTKSTTIKEQQINFQELLKLEQGSLHGNTKIIIGRISKRMIDLGRAKFLKGELVRYCSDQITPQNFVIISSLS